MKQLFLVLVAAAVLATSAHAVTITLNSYDNDVTATVNVDGATKYVYAGAFYVSIDGNGPKQAWCVDLVQNVVSSWQAVQKTTLPNALVDGARRPDYAMGVLWKNLTVAQDSSEVKHAALQLAIWEALYDGTSINLSGGRFKVSSVSNNTVLGLAQSYLQTWGGIGIINGTLLEAPPPGTGTNSQDLILTPPGNFDPQVIPENTTFLLMGLGLVAIGGVLVRQRG